jgi:hypothetical protein
VRKRVITPMPRKPPGALTGEYTLSRRLDCRDLWSLATATAHLTFTFVAVLDTLVVRIENGLFDYGQRISDAVTPAVGVGLHRNIDPELPMAGDELRYWCHGQDAHEALRIIEEVVAGGGWRRYPMTPGRLHDRLARSTDAEERASLTRKMLEEGRRSYRPLRSPRGGRAREGE